VKWLRGTNETKEQGNSHNSKHSFVAGKKVKVSPPFEGGVAGTIDYLYFT
jgi:hypothetical protein